ESFSQRSITQQHEVPRLVGVVAGVGDPGPFQPVSIFRVSSDKPREILLLDESRRRQKVILRQPIFFSNFECSLPAVAGYSAEAAAKAGSAKVGISNFENASR